jgi:hypothetical protein
MDPTPGNTFHPGTLHKFAYAANNPVNRADPSGKDDIEEYVWVAAEQIHHITFARGLGTCTAMGLGLGVAALDSAASGATSS